MKIMFIVPDGVGIKNYLYAKIIPLLYDKGYETALLHRLHRDAIEEIKNHHKIRFQDFKLLPYKETLVIKFLRESIAYARLIYNTKITGNNTIMTNWSPQKKGLKHGFYKMTEAYGKWLSTDYEKIIKAEKRLSNALKKLSNPYTQLLGDYNPDVILNLHQRAYGAILPVIAAQKKGITNSQVIFSWDNLPKARLTVRTDEYLVWSEYMKNEMQLYYPEIAKNNIYVTGTPQFEYYFDDTLIWPKEKFYGLYRIPLHKKILLYSGGDSRTSPFDGDYAYEIALQLNELPGDQRPVLLIRPVPSEDGSRYKKAVEDFPETVRLAPADWQRMKHWSESFPHFSDVELLVNTVHYCEAVINVGSTMALDFATKNKPAIYVDFNIKNSKDWDIKIINSFQHFKSMNNLDPVFRWQKKEELTRLIKRILSGEKKPDALKWLYRINNYPKDASRRIVDYLTK